MTSSLAHKNIAAINLSSYTQVSSVEKESPKGWIDYGDKNLFPQYLAELADSSPVHGSLVRSISQMVAGKKITSDDLSAVIKMRDLGINQKLNECTSNDLTLQGGYFWEVVWSMDRSEIASVNHLPSECCRLAYDKDSGDVIGIYYSNDWSNIRKKRNTPKYIPLLDERKKATEARQVYFRFKNYTTANYYGKSDYISALSYIELSRQIGLFHVNNIQNGLFPSFVVNMNNGVPETEEEMELVKRDIERNISGARNAGKFIVMFNENKDRAAEFVPFPVTDADKVYQLMEDTCTRQIMMAHRVTSPLLFGIRDNGGLGSNKDEMETALQIFNEQVIQPTQRMIEEGIEEILQLCNISADVYIVMNDEEMVDDNASATTTQVTTTSNADDMVVAADVSYNGAQISSALDIIAKVKEGVLTEEQAAIFLIQFLQLPEEVAKSFFVGSGAIAVEKLSAHLKKKVKLEKETAPTFTKEAEDYWIERLKNKGEVIDDEWELVSEEECGSASEESDIVMGLRNVNMSLSEYAKPDEKSNWGDTGLYKLRYAYSTNLSENSRDFCKAMVSTSLQGYVYRFEDIKEMSEKGENEQFAPQGQSTYDIFTWKGGAYCHHKWMRRIYFRKREGGKFLPNDGLKNDKRVGNNPFVKPKGAEGIAPNDTPSRGSLKYS